MGRVSISRHSQRGAIAVIVAISIAVLIGFIGLALDLGKLYVAKTELQNGSDACALAAAQALTGTNANQLTLAESAGIAAGTLNKVMFQSEAVSILPDNNVTFSQTLNGSYATKSAISASDVLKMTVARCTVNRTGIVNWFVQALNAIPGISIGNQAVAATAVASLRPGQTSCPLPVAICDEGANGVASAKVGDWITGALDPKSHVGGSFRWVDVGSGARAIKDVLTSSAVCPIPPGIGQPINLKPGNNNGVNDAWDTRFGLYKGSYSAANAVPDFTGYSYTPKSWAPGSNAYADFQSQRKVFAPYQGDLATGLSTSGTPSSSATHKDGANRRIDIFPVVNCGTFDSTGSAPLLKWACMLMLHPIGNNWGYDPGGGAKMYLEYRGLATDPANPCVTMGLPGGPSSVAPKVPTLVQ